MKRNLALLTVVSVGVLILANLLWSTGQALQNPALDDRFCGDANGDGNMDITDAIQILSSGFWNALPQNGVFILSTGSRDNMIFVTQRVADIGWTVSAGGPNNKVVFAPGIVTGTSAPSSGRLSVGGKSPLTGGIKEANAGTPFSQKLARLGYRAVVVEGQPKEIKF